MSVQQLKGKDVDGKLDLSWILLGPEKVISIQVAKDVEFTDTLRTYITPRTTSCKIDIGFGTWFFRVGVWVGSEKIGTVQYSGVYGPVSITSLFRTHPITPSRMKILQTQGTSDGLRIHTGSQIHTHALMEYSTDPNFPQSKTKTIYGYDFGNGYLDCVGLEPAHTYSVRVANVLNPFTETSVLGAWAVVHQKKAKVGTNPHDLQDAAIRASDKVLLREAKEKPNLRFTSQSDYIRHLAAKARHLGSIE